MNNRVDDNRSCSSPVFDPLKPATAAVDNLKFFPQKEFKRLRLLSERDDTIRCESKYPSTQSAGDDITKLISNISITSDQDAISKKQRRLVRCIACGSRLAQLDSSNSITGPERGFSTISRLSQKRF